MPEPTPRIDPEIAAALAEREAFDSGFKRSQRGNWWRVWRDKSVSIFRRRDDQFGWSIADDKDQPRFSRSGYETEEDALDALARELDVGQW